MALTLRNDITATQTTIDVNGADTLRAGSYRQLASEVILIRTAVPQNLQPGQTAWQRLSVDRGIENSEPVAHDAGVTMGTYSGGGGGSGVTVDPGDGTPVPVTTIVAPGWVINGDTAEVYLGATATGTDAAEVGIDITAEDGAANFTVEAYSEGGSAAVSIFATSDTQVSSITLQTGAAPSLTVSTSGGGFITLAAPSLGFFDANPATQPAAIADATDPASTMARLNDVLAALRLLGLIDT